MWESSRIVTCGFTFILSVEINKFNIQKKLNSQNEKSGIKKLE